MQKVREEKCECEKGREAEEEVARVALTAGPEVFEAVWPA